VLEHAVGDGVTPLVRWRIAGPHDQNVVQEHLGFQVEVPLISVLHDIAHELQNSDGAEVVGTR